MRHSPWLHPAVVAAAAVGILLALAGAPRASDEDQAKVDEVTTVIQCFCGDCVHQTLHDCTCGFAAREKARIARMIAEGESPDAIEAMYIEEQGPQVRIVPERRGLDLIGYAIPYAGAALGVVALTLVLLRWRRQSVPRLQPAGEAGLRGDPDGRYADRLRRDLEELD